MLTAVTHRTLPSQHRSLFAKVSQTDTELFDGLARAAACPMGSFNIQDLANTAYAFMTRGSAVPLEAMEWATEWRERYFHNFEVFSMVHGYLYMK